MYLNTIKSITNIQLDILTTKNYQGKTTKKKKTYIVRDIILKIEGVEGKKRNITMKKSILRRRRKKKKKRKKKMKLRKNNMFEKKFRRSLI